MKKKTESQASTEAITDAVKHLRKSFNEHPESLNNADLRILCALDDEVMESISYQKAQELGFERCSYNGMDIKVPISAYINAQGVKDKQKAAGYHNVRTFLGSYENSDTPVLASKSTWFSEDETSEKTYKQIEKATSIKPLYVNAFFGKLIVDCESAKDAGSVERYLKTVKKGYQVLIIEPDAHNSIDVYRVTMLEKSTKKTLLA